MKDNTPPSAGVPAIPPETLKELRRRAEAVRLYAHAPYSDFRVGAALLCRDGGIFTGCNVENLSYGLTVCAERTAICSAVAAGKKEFSAIALVADTRQPISPCGACRQFLAEFGDAEIFSFTLSGRMFRSSVSLLLPRGKTGILDSP